MGEKIRSNMNIILNIITTLVIFGMLAVGYGQTKGKILQVEANQGRLEQRQNRQDDTVEEIQTDVKKILKSVGVIEGKLSRTHLRIKE